LGGEKLKSSRPFRAVLFAGLVIFSGFLFLLTPQYAKSQELTPDSGPVPGPASGPVSPSASEFSFIFDDTPQPAPVFQSESSVFVMLRMVLVLALAALAIYGVVFFVKRISKPQEVRDPHLKILAKAPLSNDTFAAVISVGAKAWLVGGSSGGVNLISEIDETESLETMLLDEARRSADAGTRALPDFRSLLGRFGGNRLPVSENADPGSSHAENLRKQRERLKGL